MSMFPRRMRMLPAHYKAKLLVKTCYRGQHAQCIGNNAHIAMNEQGLWHDNDVQDNFSYFQMNGDAPIEVLGYNPQLSAVKMDGFEVPYLL